MPKNGGEAADSGWNAERVTLGRHFIRDMEGLWEGVLKLSAIVETTINASVRALCEGRPELALEVKGGERTVNAWEVQIERDCLKMLALHQPVAGDLRRVAAVLRINSDLERMADLAKHMAKRVRKAASDPDGTPPIPEGLEQMAGDVLGQVRDALDALSQSDVDLAQAVIVGDRRVDRQHRHVLAGLKQSIRSDPERLDGWFRLINSARNLERIADHATNIAEVVIYLRDGAIIRHEQAPQGLRP